VRWLTRYMCRDGPARTAALFVWLISPQPAVLFSQNKSVIRNQPTVLFSQNKPAPAISQQPTEQVERRHTYVPSTCSPRPLLSSHHGAVTAAVAAAIAAGVSSDTML
jgi:hypothetical protein